MIRQLRLVVLLCFVAVAGSQGFADDTLFPFVVSYDSPANVTNLAGWLEKPAGGNGFVRIEDVSTPI